VRIVLDTNVIVSALLREASVPGQVLDLCIAGEVGLVVDERILAEYRDVLIRRELGLDAAAVKEFLGFMNYAEHVVGLPLPFKLADADDMPFLEVAVAAGADAIVTGNTKHFKLREGRLAIAIMTPRAFLDRLGGVDG
jgi:uncharacterized protein